MILQPREYDKLHKKIEAVYEIDTPDEFPQKALQILYQLVSSDNCGYSEIHRDLYSSPKKPVMKVIEFPVITMRQAVRSNLPKYIHQHPTIARFTKTQDGAPYKISDFLSLRAFHRLDLYQEFYRHKEAEYQINFYLMPIREYLIAITLSRSLKDFSEQDRLMLQLIRPHLYRAYRNLLSIEDFHKSRKTLEVVMRQVGKGMIEITEDGIIRSITDLAKHFLKSYFGITDQSLDRLPLLLQTWIEERQSLDAKKNGPQSRIFEQAEKVLHVQIFREENEPFTVLLLKEDIRQSSSIMKPTETFGLTPREVEVLHWVSMGKTNQTIGIILNIRPATVRKHLERIFIKLGVENRTSAASLYRSD